MPNQWEVEQKYIVTNSHDLQTRLAQNGFTSIGVETNSDVYFRHPCRDLKATDEAFRLRTKNDSSCVTYKGKRLPGPVKSRPEIELPIQHIDREKWLNMLVLLGFVPLPEVKKCRETFALSASSLAAANSHAREGVPLVFDVHVTLDQVEQLGNFAEIEIIVTSEGELQRAAAQISVVAERLNLASVQPRSYLSLLLTKLELE